MNNADTELSGLLVLPGDFPMQELVEVSECLRKADVFVPGYLSVAEDPYDISELIRDSLMEGVRTTLLPDRNVVSRIAQLAMGEPANHQRQLSAAILGLAQCLNMAIEPSIAFHELAPNHGNDRAAEELSWFHGADDSHPLQWLHVGVGKAEGVSGIQPKPANRPLDLARPLFRWRRNYIVALKIAELELTKMSALDRTLSLFDWMYRDFILAGPAGIFACIYFAPISPPRQGLLKALRSPDRERALRGIQNAAWDITHISDFIYRVNDGVDSNNRYLLATFDKGLHQIASTLMNASVNEQAPEEALAKRLSRWWPTKEAWSVAESLYGYYRRGRDPSWLESHKDHPNYIDELILSGETVIREWNGA